jgi:hypothetical protein
MFRLTAAVALLVLFACKPAETPPPAQPAETTTPPSPAPPAQNFAVSTDRNSYQMIEGPYGPEVTITTTIRAPRDKRVYITNCNGAIGTGLQRLVGGKWEYAWAQEMNACLSAPIIIEPGQEKTTTILAASGEHAAVDARRNSSRIEGGTYRVGWHGLYTSWDLNKRPWGEELPLEQRVSAPFTIAPPQPHDPKLTSPRQRPEQIRFVAPEHLVVVTGRHPVSVGFTAPESTLRGEPQLYIDREWVERPQRIYLESKPPAGLELQHTPKQAWKPGLHEVRVIYQDKTGRLRWYAWAFVAK